VGVLHFFRTLLGSFNKPSHDYVASTLSFPELDVERMKRRMRLEEEGQRRGTRNEPATDSLSRDDIEQRIITTIESEKRLAHDKLVDHLKTYGDRIASLAFQSKCTQALVRADSAISNFRAHVHTGADRLFQLRRDLIQMGDEIAQFRREHGLQRLPRYPQSRLLQWGVIVVLFVLEGLLNGTFLARGHELGLVGGISEALLIAAVNIVIGLRVGWKVVPWMVHRRPLWKWMGVGGVVLYGVFLVGFNLAVAHYRYALGGEQPEHAAQLALASVLAHPLGIADLQAWFLFLLGCGFSLVAAAEGWSMDDPYPGYGPRARHQTQLIEDYAEEKQALMAELEDLRNAAIEHIEADTMTITRQRAEYHAILEARTRLQRSFSQHLAYLEQCGNELLATYREANRRTRTTPPPPHFAHPWEMPQPADPTYGHEGSRRDGDLETDIGRFFDQLQEKCQGVHKEYETAVFQYKTIDALTPEVLRDGRFRSPQEETGS
jgi:hypothetical protein